MGYGRGPRNRTPDFLALSDARKGRVRTVGAPLEESGALPGSFHHTIQKSLQITVGIPIALRTHQAGALYLL